MSFLFIFVTSDYINIWKKGNEKSSLPNKRFTVFFKIKSYATSNHPAFHLNFHFDHLNYSQF